MSRPSRLYRFLAARWWLTLILLGASFVLFGVMSLNLVTMLAANIAFLREHGLVAVQEGALRQLAELLVSGYAAALFYLVFKLCERVLVDALSTARAERARAASRRRAAPATPKTAPKATPES